MLYIPCMVILGDRGIRNISFKNFDFELATVKNCISSLCTHPLGDPAPRPTPHPIPKWGKNT